MQNNNPAFGIKFSDSTTKLLQESKKFKLKPAIREARDQLLRHSETDKYTLNVTNLGQGLFHQLPHEMMVEVTSAKFPGVKAVILKGEKYDGFQSVEHLFKTLLDTVKSGKFSEIADKALKAESDDLAKF